MTGYIVPMLERVLGADIQVVFHFDPGVEWQRYYRGRIEQILFKLSLNARTSMPKGGQLIIRLTKTDLASIDQQTFPWVNPGQFIVLSVSDTGSGMDEETLKKVREPFFTGEFHDSDRELSVVYQFVRLHAGLVEIESNPGLGSTFRIFLPKCSSSGERTPKPPQNNQEGDETILLVDDEPSVRRAVQMLLERSGYRVLVAEDGMQAVEVFDQRANEIDLLLTDVVMPRMDGFEAAKRILEIKRLPVLFCSGYSASVLRADEQMLSESQILAKPYSPTKLRALIREMLDSWKTQERAEV